MALLVPDDLWAVVEPLLPPDRLKPKDGRPRASNRAALAGILFVLRTGIQWHELPMELGCCGKTCWRRLGEWHAAGVWAGLHRVLHLRSRWKGSGGYDHRRCRRECRVRSIKSCIARRGIESSQKLGRYRWPLGGNAC